MEEKELKTSLKTRIFIAVIAIIMVGSIIASYIAIVLSGNNSGSNIDTAKLAEYQQQYNEAEQAFEAGSKEDFDKFVPYRSEVVAYDETTANDGGLQTRDLVVGEGKELVVGDSDYLAFYVGWCADDSVFDSTFNNSSDPTAFSNVLDVPQYGDGLIEGWKAGVVGMKLGGIREITVPGAQAYPEKEVCGGLAKPLKFIIMAVANEDPLKSLAEKLTLASNNVQYYAATGMSYEEIMQGTNTPGEASESTMEAEN